VRSRASVWAALLVLCACGGQRAAGASAAPYAPYLEVTAGSAPPDLPAVARASGVREIVLAFVVNGARPCSASWEGQLPADGRSLGAAVRALRAAGVRVAISFGGETGPQLAQSCRTPAALASAYAGVLARYHPARADFDLEGSALTNAGVRARTAAALALLERSPAAHGVAVSLTLPAVRGGIDPAGRIMLAAAAAHRVRVDRVNLLAFDWGVPVAPPQMVTLAAAAAARARHQTRAPLGVTVMAGVNDDAGETFTLADAVALAAWARGAGVALSMWSLSRDQPCPHTGGPARDDCSGVAQAPYAFSQALRSA
jgi:hypothetical protein